LYADRVEPGEADAVNVKLARRAPCLQELFDEFKLNNAEVHNIRQILTITLTMDNRGIKIAMEYREKNESIDVFVKGIVPYVRPVILTGNQTLIS